MGNVCLTPVSVRVEDSGSPVIKAKVLPVITEKIKIEENTPEPKLKNMKRNLVL